MSTVFFTSDHHFGHRNISFYTKRYVTIPGLEKEDPDIRLMDEFMIEQWNITVGKDDLVIHLGDFSLGPKCRRKEIVKRLNGKKIIVMGNHDPGVKSLREVGFAEVHRWLAVKICGDPVLLVHNSGKWLSKKLWYDYIICGHVHDLWKRRGNALNVSVEQFIFKPITIPQAGEELSVDWSSPSFEIIGKPSGTGKTAERSIADFRC